MAPGVDDDASDAVSDALGAAEVAGGSVGVLAAPSDAIGPAGVEAVVAAPVFSTGPVAVTAFAGVLAFEGAVFPAVPVSIVDRDAGAKNAPITAACTTTEPMMARAQTHNPWPLK